jgi:hypothetical protein
VTNYVSFGRNVLVALDWFLREINPNQSKIVGLVRVSLFFLAKFKPNQADKE